MKCCRDKARQTSGIVSQSASEINFQIGLSHLVEQVQVGRQIFRVERVECGVPCGIGRFSVGDGWRVCSTVAHAVGEACDPVGVLSFFAELVAGEIPVGA